MWGHHSRKQNMNSYLFGKEVITWNEGDVLSSKQLKMLKNELRPCLLLRFRWPPHAMNEIFDTILSFLKDPTDLDENDPWNFSHFEVPEDFNLAIQSFDQIWKEGKKTPKDFAILSKQDPLRIRLAHFEEKLRIPTVLYYAAVSFGTNPDQEDDTMELEKGIRRLGRCFDQWVQRNRLGLIQEFSKYLEKERGFDLDCLPRKLDLILICHGLK